MNILLFHCSFHNQGDVLMLLSAKKIMEEVNPNAKFYILASDSPNKQILIDNHINLINLNIDYLVYNIPKYYRFISKIYKIIKKQEFSKLKGIEMVLDVNGYFLGDKWGVTMNNYKYFHFFKKLQMKIVFMPKSFGLFKNKLISGNAVAIMSCADLIFARDAISLQEINRIAPFLNNVKLNSDYTSICDKLNITANVKLFEGKVPIIINNRMTWKSDNGIDDYKRFLNNCIEILKENNLEYYFLLHDYKRDINFMKELNMSSIKVVYCSDTLELKGYSSVAKLVISSRYHGILNALNSQTPIIGTAWAHKYVEIAEEYGIAPYILDLSVDKDSLRKLIKSALNREQNHIVNDIVVSQSRNDLIKKITEEIALI